MLIWGTGLEGLWRVDLRVGGPPVGGFREIAGPIRVVGGSILVTSYDSLTMAAQYADVRLPQAHERDQQVEVPDGDYRCLVVQMFDPASESTAGEASPDFILVLSELSGGVPAWLEIPWFIDTEPSDYRLENDPGFLQRIARARESLQAGKGIRLEELKTKSRSLHRRTKRGS
jgi:hypothetical protein